MVDIKRRAEISLEVAGKDRKFRYSIGALEEICEHEKAPEVLLRRMLQGEASLDDIRVVLGAGLRDHPDVKEQVAEIIEDSFVGAREHASLCMEAALCGGFEVDEDKDQPAPEKIKAEATGGLSSTSPPSTELVQ